MNLESRAAITFSLSLLLTHQLLPSPTIVLNLIMASASLPPNTTTTGSTGTDNAPPAATVPDEDPGVDLPMTMSASVILTNLPKDASEALGEVEALDKGKGMDFFLFLPVRGGDRGEILTLRPRKTIHVNGLDSETPFYHSSLFCLL